MISAPPTPDEAERHRLLEDLEILDTLEEQAYDDLTGIAAEICRTPISLVSLVDENRQWFKSHHGMDARETSRDVAFCAHAIHQDEIFEIEDSTRDARFYDNPLVRGNPRVIFYAGAPLTLNNCRLGTLCVIDHEPRKLTQAQRNALTALSRQVVSQLELRLQVKELKALDHAKDEFIAMVSHEMRTPLTSIQLSLSMLSSGKTGPMEGKARRFLDTAYRNCLRLKRTVNDILDVAQMEAGRFDLVRSELGLVGLLRQAVELNREYCEECGCSLVLRIAPDLDGEVVVQGDPDRLLNIVENLISNAAKFTTKGDQIEIRLAREGRSARIEVEDHGPGIAEEKRRLLFQKLKQLGDDEFRKLPGTGLGLYIARQLVELHDGEIGCESIEGEGTTFYFTLPCRSLAVSVR